MRPIIELKKIDFCFPGQAKLLFSDLDFQINEGESISLSGENGTGKSTLMKIIATLVRPQKGDYLYRGETLDKNFIELRNRINYSTGGTLGFYPRLTAIENLLFFSGLKGEMISPTEAAVILLKVGLKESDFDKKYFKYSLGMKQRMHLAKLFLEPSELLLIDEPTNGLDHQGYEMLIKLLNVDLGKKTKVVISHDSVFLSQVTSVKVRIENGKLVK